MTRTSFVAPVLNERFIITHEDLTDTDTSQTINLMTLPKGSIVKGVRTKCATIFSGGSVSALTVSVGCAAGAVDTFSPAYSIMAVVADTTAQMVSGWKAATYAADTLTATFVSTTDNLDQLSAGVVYLDVEILLMPDLTATAVPSGSTGGYV